MAEAPVGIGWARIGWRSPAFPGSTSGRCPHRHTMMLIGGLLPTGEEAQEGWLQIGGEHVVASGLGAPPGTPDVIHEGIIGPGLCDLQVNGAAGVEVAGGSSALDPVDETMLAQRARRSLPTVVRQ